MEGGASTGFPSSAGSIILGGSCAALVCCTLAHLRSPVAGASTEGSCDITGGCLCGAVRYRLSTPAKSTYHCHCLMCRKIHGALFATFSVFPSTSWKLTGGQLSVYCSSPGTTRQFCATCGCEILSTVSSVAEDVFVTCGSMDAHVHPGHSKHTEAHIFAEDRTCWKDFV
eukprot:COSAG02_NODE_23769_length_709_cov_0.603279_2_plen_169_part_01